MTQTLRFFRIDKGEMAGWYADVPGHTLEDNQMVSDDDRSIFHRQHCLSRR